MDKDALKEIQSRNGRKVAEQMAREGKNITSSERGRELNMKSQEAKREAKKRKRAMQDIARWLGEMAVKEDLLFSADEIETLEKAEKVNLTGAEALVLAQYTKAIQGDTKAAEFIRDTAGEKPKEQIEVQGMTIDEYAQNHKPKF